MATKVAQHHAEWLSLVEASGPFLSVPVLSRAFPQGLDPDDPEHCRDLGIAMREFEDDLQLQHRWVRWVLERTLEYPGEVIRGPGKLPSSLSHHVAEHGATLAPDLAIGDGDKPRILVTIWPPEQGIEERIDGEGWTASPQERMAELLRAKEIRLGLVTNGERWTLVSAKQGESTGFAGWDAALWLEDRITLRAFRTVLGVERTLGAPRGESLEDLLDESAEAQQEVTDQLGKQVRFAIELLVSSLDRADRERQGDLLKNIEDRELYLAAVSVMMRLVFLFTAEERGLLPLNDELYANSYAASTIRAQLQEEADRHSEEPLERRSSAWFRLLACFRAVHAGASHDQLHLPAYGGQLFDPDRFPFLEGRTAETSWAEVASEPLPIDDRTVLHVLDALQMLRIAGRRGAGEAQRLSYRALDVEQIGHVYEGLLDHTALRITDAALGFEGKHEPEIALAILQEQREEGDEAFCEWLAKETGRSASALQKRLDIEPDADRYARLRAQCEGDEELLEQVLPFQALLRTDLRGYPTVFLPGAVYVTEALDRRSSGTYYTTRALAEEVVKHALDPIAYSPGPAEEADPEKWELKPAAELLELKVCDMAMGSGAFLVAACRYLAECLLGAWEKLGEGSWTPEGEPASSKARELTLPADPAERLTLARRLVADRCLYGVDKNRMAVDMAKLSLWLITMAKDRPFTFLDHALRSGDSLLGITDLKQIEHFHIDPKRGAEVHGTLFDYTAACGDAVKRALATRRELEEFTALDIQDAERKKELNDEATEALEDARLVSDLVIGAALATAEDGDVDSALLSVSDRLNEALDQARSGEQRAATEADLRRQAWEWLNAGRPPGLASAERQCLHWPLEFPEAYERGGFDAVVGNPPFLGGTKISGPLGRDFRQFIAGAIGKMRTDRADLCAFFLLRAATLVRSDTGVIGLLTTNTISQADTRAVGLDRLTPDWTIFRAVKSLTWPGTANVHVAKLWLSARVLEMAPNLDGEPVALISPSLEPASRIQGEARRLAELDGFSFEGTVVYGDGFLLSPDEARALVEREPRSSEVVHPYLSGRDVTSSPDQAARRYAINLSGLSLQQAKSYGACFEVLEERVYPDRMKKPDRYRQLKEQWWCYHRPRRELYAAIRNFQRVIVVVKVSKAVTPVFVPTGQVLSNGLAVLAYDDDSHFGLLSSGFHWWWVMRQGSTMKSDVRYTPTDCFETFPQPEMSDDLAAAGAALNAHRQRVMMDRQEGLTTIFNRLHDPNCTVPGIAELRELHRRVDEAVRDCYGWSDLELNYGYRHTRHGVRYTFEPAVRIEAIDRLLELNHSRYNAEVRSGLHGNKAETIGKSLPQPVNLAQGSLL